MLKFYNILPFVRAQRALGLKPFPSFLVETGAIFGAGDPKLVKYGPASKCRAVARADNIYYS